MEVKKAHKLHRALWDWIFHHPSKSTEDWPEWEKNGGDIDAGFFCFACIVAGGSCMVCPIDWESEGVPLCWSSKGSSYTRFCKAKSPKTQKKYAAKVRDIPWKYETEKQGV